jgi:hypothetical protein
MGRDDGENEKENEERERRTQWADKLGGGCVGRPFVLTARSEVRARRAGFGRSGEAVAGV